MSFPPPFYRWRPHPWHGLEIGPNPPHLVHAYIEITPFDLVKYEIDKTTGYLRVDRPQRSSSQPPALYGFVLLRKDRPNWPRPIRLSTPWVGLAFILATINLFLLVCGGFLFADEYGYGLDKTLIGLAVLVVAFLLYIYRHVVQDKTGLRFRDENVPTMPEGEQAAPAPTPSS